MKLRTFTHNGSTKIGKLIGEEILDFSIACPDLPTDMVGLLTAGDAALGQARNASEIPNAMMVAFKDVRLEAPVLNPSKFLAIGMNYKDHATSPVNNLRKPPETVMADQINFVNLTKVSEQFGIRPSTWRCLPSRSSVDISFRVGGL
jgi:2-keto-4-pentenoate hydratase/2-oxohepta-3-ene-1,7-dioic acid hydratase in catechol pathway